MIRRCHRLEGLVFACLVAVAAGPRTATAQMPLNLDFERPSVAGPDRPWGWTLGWSAFAGGPAATFALDDAVRRDGERSLRIEMPRGTTPGGPPQTIMRMLPSRFALGRELRLVGWMRTQGLEGRALLTLEAWRDRAFAAADTASITAGPGSSDWVRHELTIRVPDDDSIHSIVVAASLEGGGAAWFDALELRIDGAPISTLPLDANPPSPDDLEWLSQHAAPLATVAAPVAVPADDSDLRLFADIVGDARIVALGESTHGTREFFQVKHRLLEYLVRELGFRVFAVEANQLAVEKVDRYVRGGEGSARDAMRTMFAVWNTQAMLEMVEWMRGWNEAHPESAVRFVGYDMQDHDVPFDSLMAYLEENEPALAPVLEERLGEYRRERSYATPQVADTVRARWHRQAESLWSEVSGRRDAWLSRSTDRADSLRAEWAVQAAELLRQAARFNVALSSPERDSLMAANLEWALRTLAPGARAVVWAHDVHVSRGGDPELSFNAGAQMGAYLARAHGEGYRAFGLLTHDGWYRATRSFTDHESIEAEAFPGPPGSLERALHDLPRPAGSVGLVVDLRPAREGEGGAWLRVPRPIRHVGYAAYDYGFELLAVSPLEFDGIVFIDSTTASRPLP